MVKNRIVATIGIHLAFLLAGCANYQAMRYDSTDLVGFRHALTEKASADVRAAAKNSCGRVNKLALQTEKNCTLTTCTTYFRCEEAAEIIKYGNQAEVVK